LHTKKRYSNDDCRNDILDSIETLLKKSNKNYFSSILQVNIPGTAVNSTSHNLSCECSTRTITGAKVSGVLSSKIWHELSDAIPSSDSLSCFKKNLKLFFFSGFYQLTFQLFVCNTSSNSCLVSRTFN